MQVSEVAFRRIVDGLHDGLYFTDLDRVITYWNRSAATMTGFDAAEVVGRSCSDGILNHVDGSGRRLCGRNCPLAETMLDGRPREAEVYLHHADGHRVPVEVRVSAITDERGQIIGGIELFNEISNREANELRLAELQRISELDHVTQLPNRRFLDAELTRRLEQLREGRVPFGVLFFDVDRFKRFNDRHGHGVGDDVLRVVGRALLANARSFDVYGRWGGDEFLGIVRDVDADTLASIAERMRVAVGASSVRDAEVNIGLSVSIGAALAHPEDSVADLLDRADALLYASKTTGRDRVSSG